MTRISKEGEYIMKQSLINLRNYVEKLALEALDSNVIDTITENKTLIEKAISRIENMTKGRDFSSEVREELQLFDKTGKEALKRIENHYEVVEKRENPMKSIQIDEEDVNEIGLKDIGRMYEEATQSTSLDEKQMVLESLRKIHEELLEKIHNLNSVEHLSPDELDKLYQKIDNIHMYCGNLDNQIEELKKNNDNSQQEILDPSNYDSIVKVTEHLVSARNALEQGLDNNDKEIQDRIDIITRMIDENNTILEKMKKSENGLLLEEIKEFCQESEPFYQEAMETVDRDYLMEVINYFEESLENWKEMDVINEEISLKIKDLECKMRDLQNKLLCMDNEIETNNFYFLTDEEIESFYQEALSTTNMTRKKEIQEYLKEECQRIVASLENNEFDDSIVEEMQEKVEKLSYFTESIEKNIAISPSPQYSHKKGIKNLFVNRPWFKKKAKDTKKGKKVACIVGGVGAIIATICAVSLSKAKNDQSGVSFKQLQSQEFDKEKPKTIISKNNAHLKEAVSVLSEFNYSSKDDIEVGILTQETKEEKIMNLVKELKDRFNVYDGLNVTTSQALSLYIHLNATNSYEKPNDTLVLDKITRENLIKKYYVGLTKDMEEFNTYELSDNDLSRLSEDMYAIRKATFNRVAVLNDQGKYDESREIIAIFKDFISEEALQDETSVLINSIQEMQTNDKQKKKEHIYRYYNYIFAGKKSDIRNFDQYGCYVDGDEKEMTYENQPLTIRTLTWFMDGFVGLNITNDLIPQDIINTKEAKLRDLASLFRILGYKNCEGINRYYQNDFDTPIDNKIKKSSGTTKSSSKPAKNIAEVLETPKLDEEMNAGLKENTNVGDSFKLSDQSTVTVVESGSKDTTVIVQPNPSSAKVEDTTPPGTNQKETVEGGGNETTEPIKFTPSPTEQVIEEGGDIISDGGNGDEETTVIYQTEVYQTEIYQTDEYQTDEYQTDEYQTEVYQTDGYQTKLSLPGLYKLKGELLNKFSQTQINQTQISFNESYYVKTYHI